MANYAPVKRVITVEFRPAEKPKDRLDVVVTPDYLVVRSGDTIEWAVSGLSDREAARVTIGNFQALAPAAIVKMKSGKLKLGKPNVMDEKKLVRPKRDGWLIHETKNLELGSYKFDVMVDGKVVCDPDIEIRGPRA